MLYIICLQKRCEQGCVLAPTLFRIFFAVLLKHAQGSATEDIYLQTRLDGRIFILFTLRAKTKVQVKCMRGLLSANDAPVTTHSAKDLKRLITCFSEAFRNFGFIISLKKTQVMGQDVDSPPVIRISDHELDVVRDFVHLCFTFSDSLCLDAELKKRIAWASETQVQRFSHATLPWSRDPQHIYLAVAEVYALAWTCSAHERWQDLF